MSKAVSIVLRILRFLLLLITFIYYIAFAGSGVSASTMTSVEINSGQPISLTSGEQLSATSSSGISVAIKNLPDFQPQDKGLAGFSIEIRWDASHIRVDQIKVSEAAFNDGWSIYTGDVTQNPGTVTVVGYKTSLYSNADIVVFYLGITALQETDSFSDITPVVKEMMDNFGNKISPVLAVSSTVYSGTGINNKPLAFIDSINATGTSVIFRGHGQDTDGHIIAYQWNSDLNGIISYSANFTSSSLSAGHHSISFKVRDNSGYWSDPVVQDIYFSNEIQGQDSAGETYPKAFIDDISASTAVRGTEIKFLGHGEADVISEISGCRWTSNIDDTIGTSYSFSTSSLSVGKHTISFQVWDNKGVYSKLAVAALQITPSVPVVTVFQIPDSAIYGSLITLKGAGATTYGMIGTWEWVSSIDGYLGSTKEVVTDQLSAGNHTISFRVRDNLGTWSDEVKGQLYIEPVKPTLKITTDFPGIIQLGESHTIDVSIIAHSETVVDFKVISSIDGLISTNQSFDTQTLSEGLHRITCKAHLSDGTLIDRVVTIIITSDFAGKDMIAVPANAGWFNTGMMLKKGDTVSVEAAGLWSYNDNGGVCGPEGISSLNVIDRLIPGIPAGGLVAKIGSGLPFFVGSAMTWTVETAGELYFGMNESSDGLPDNESSIQIQLEIASELTKPTAVILAPTSDKTNVNEEVRFQGFGQDTDGQVTGYKWVSDVDGLLSNAKEFSTGNLSAGNHTIYLVVQDNDQLWSDPVSIMITVQQSSKWLWLWFGVLGFAMLGVAVYRWRLWLFSKVTKIVKEKIKE